MKLLKELIPLAESAHLKADAAFVKLVSGFDNRLPHSSRFKSFDFSVPSKWLEWVTQESSADESAETADTIAELLYDAGFVGWTVKVVNRDLQSGRASDVPWEVARS